MRLIGTFFLLLMMTGVLVEVAGAQPDPERMRERMQQSNQELIKKLDLSDEQLPVVTSILDDQLEKRTSMFEERSAGFSGMREKMRELEKETSEKLGEILTDTQMEKYRKHLEEGRQNRRRGNPPGPSGRIN